MRYLVPGRLPSTIKNAKIETAERLHPCHRNDTHRIRNGDKRLAITVGRDTHRYCVACARAAILRDQEKLANLLAGLDD